MNEVRFAKCLPEAAAPARIATCPQRYAQCCLPAVTALQAGEA